MTVFFLSHRHFVYKVTIKREISEMNCKIYFLMIASSSVTTRKSRNKFHFSLAVPSVPSERTPNIVRLASPRSSAKPKLDKFVNTFKIFILKKG